MCDCIVGNGPVNAVAFDYSGVYLGIGGGGNNGNQVHVKVVKDWSSSAVSDFLFLGLYFSNSYHFLLSL